MRIAIEAQRIFRRDKHGMDFVALETIRELQKRNDGNEYYVLVAPGEDHCLESSANLSIIEIKCPTYPLWEQVALPRMVKKLGVDMLHCTSNTAPLWCSVPIVLTLHDVIFLHTAKEKSRSYYQQMGWYYRRLVVPRIVHKCKKIITVSYTAYQEIVHYFPELINKISVVHNAFSTCFYPVTEAYAITQKYYSTNQPYLFCLGNTDPRKNVKGILIAYDDYLKRSSQKLHLVITGLSKEYIQKLLIELGIKACLDKLIFIGYVPGIDLPALYSGAFTFLFPSILEGFGIPILEAMACGTPVITSRTSAMPEVAGEGCILIDPFKPQEIADALLRLENDRDYYEQQRLYGLERVKLFSWKKTASAYAELYKSINCIN